MKIKEKYQLKFLKNQQRNYITNYKWSPSTYNSTFTYICQFSREVDLKNNSFIAFPNTGKYTKFDSCNISQNSFYFISPPGIPFLQSDFMQFRI